MKFIVLFLFLTSVCFAQVSQPQAVTIKPFTDKSGLWFMPDAVECTFQKSTDGNYKESTCDYTMLWTAKLDGIKILLKNHKWGDYLYLTIHHPVGDTQVARFAQKLMIDESSSDQEWIKTNYDAEIVQGLKLRFHYFTKSTTDDINAIFNLRLHQVIQ